MQENSKKIDLANNRIDPRTFLINAVLANPPVVEEAKEFTLKPSELNESRRFKSLLSNINQSFGPRKLLSIYLEVLRDLYLIDPSSPSLGYIINEACSLIYSLPYNLQELDELKQNLEEEKSQIAVEYYGYAKSVYDRLLDNIEKRKANSDTNPIPIVTKPRLPFTTDQQNPDYAANLKLKAPAFPPPPPIPPKPTAPIPLKDKK